MSDNGHPAGLPSLRIERPTRRAGSVVHPAERALLESVARVFEEVQANGIVLGVPPPPLTAEVLAGMRRRLALEAWEADELTGESPLGALHTEHNGWGPPLEPSPELPRQILAIDTIDFLIGAMGSDDVLVWEGHAR